MSRSHARIFYSFLKNLVVICAANRSIFPWTNFTLASAQTRITWSLLWCNLSMRFSLLKYCIPIQYDDVSKKYTCYAFFMACKLKESVPLAIFFAKYDCFLAILFQVAFSSTQILHVDRIGHESAHNIHWCSVFCRRVDNFGPDDNWQYSWQLITIDKTARHLSRQIIIFHCVNIIA